MKKVVVFNDSRRIEDGNAYEVVQDEANDWLDRHPNANILASHTNMAAETEWTEFCLTLIVEMPVDPLQGGNNG